MSPPMATYTRTGWTSCPTTKLSLPVRTRNTGPHRCWEHWKPISPRAGGSHIWGGNGFYWVTSVDPERPHVIEVRRGLAGTRAWNSAPGECYHSTTGELGGLWRYRGKPPNKLTGIGFTAQGWTDPAPGYTRQPGSFDERAAFIFEGIAADEIIGDFGLIFGGAAGDELDRMDHELGSPHHTLLLASSSGHGPSINPVIEDFLQTGSSMLPEDSPNVHADMVYFETPNGGGRLLGGFHLLVCKSVPQQLRKQCIPHYTECAGRFLKI